MELHLAAIFTVLKCVHEWHLIRIQPSLLDIKNWLSQSVFQLNSHKSVAIYYGPDPSCVHKSSHWGFLRSCIKHKWRKLSVQQQISFWTSKFCALVILSSIMQDLKNKILVKSANSHSLLHQIPIRSLHFPLFPPFLEQSLQTSASSKCCSRKIQKKSPHNTNFSIPTILLESIFEMITLISLTY